MVKRIQDASASTARGAEDLLHVGNAVVGFRYPFQAIPEEVRLAGVSSYHLRTELTADALANALATRHRVPRLVQRQPSALRPRIRAPAEYEAARQNDPQAVA